MIGTGNSVFHLDVLVLELSEVVLLEQLEFADDVAF
jgi:hypothetical protein